MADLQPILLVEDDKFLRTLLSNKLAREGFSVETAVDGNEGLEKILRAPSRLVLLDLILPGIDGFEVLRRLGERLGADRMPTVIILSNLGQQEDVNRGLALGAKDYMVKAHFTPSEVVEKIRRFTGGLVSALAPSVG